MKVMSPDGLQATDSAITGWMAHHGPKLLRVSLGIVFMWFGILKFFPSVSPAEELATRTIDVLTRGLIPAAVSLPVLAGWESLIGVGLLIGRGLRGILIAAVRSDARNAHPDRSVSA
jgi:uncharacterized membrane protein YphA (DoxX/SURF4 family)